MGHQGDTPANFVFAYHMRQQSPQQREAKQHLVACFVWKTSELDEHGDPLVGPCFTPQLMLGEAMLAETSLIELNNYIGSQVAVKLSEAMRAGVGDKLFDRIMAQRVKPS